MKSLAVLRYAVQWVFLGTAGSTRALPMVPLLTAMVCVASGAAIAQDSAPPVTRARITVATPPPDPSSGPATVSATAGPVAGMTPGHPIPPPTGPPIGSGLLAWDSDGKEVVVTLGAIDASFVFHVSNVSNEPVTVTRVATSCGCTVAKLPPVPWTLAPGAAGTIDVVMNLAGKRGVNIKNVLVNTDHGYQTLTVTTRIQEPPATTMAPADRAKNLQIATANRQAVLHGECASCHATPAANQTGAPLYQAACAICHEAANRAASVPDLKQLPRPAAPDYWRGWITSSAPGKLMPAFAIEHGGILSAAQIESLVQYLTATMTPGMPVSPGP